jgi:hypothetical protein
LVGDLTEQEASELAAVVFTTAFMTAAELPEGAAPVGGPQMAPYAYSEDVSFVAECALDGVADVTASLDVEGDTESEAGRIEYSLTLDHQGCTAASPSEVVFTLNGAPSVTLHLVAENDGQGNVDLEGILEGRVEWSAEGRDGGVCEMDLELAGAVSQSAQTVQFEVAGVICGFTVDASASLG